MKSERIFFDTYDYACGEKLVGLHINIQLLKKIKERGFYPREITLKVTYEEYDKEKLLTLQKEQAQ